jgi:hypothetical protein
MSLIDSDAKAPAGSPATGRGGRRGAALTATLIALPLAVAVWVGSVWWSGGFAGTATPTSSPAPRASGPVAVSLPGTVNERTETVCRALLAKLPKLLGTSAGRPVTPAAAVERAAAWGDPAIVLRCGVGAPATAKGTGQVLNFDGVDWLISDDADHAQIVRAVGREVSVELDVPGAYAGHAASLLGPLTEPLTSTVPLVK